MDEKKSFKKNCNIKISITVILCVLMFAVFIYFIIQNQTHDFLYNEILSDRDTDTDINPTEPIITTLAVLEDIINIHNDGVETGITENPLDDVADVSEPETEPTTSPPVKAARIYQNKFDRIRAKYNNDDIIGIIKIPDTAIYYPVAYNSQDTNYYLNRNLYKQNSATGSITLDFENDVERRDPSTVLYGHQMYTSNTMFHTVSYYMDEDFFNSHRYIIYNTIYEDNVWEVFAYFKTYTDFNYIKIFFRSEKDFLRLASQMKERSIYDTGIDIKEGDRILVLSTCTNIEQDSRYVLCARMIKNKNDIPEEILQQMASAAEDFK